MNKKLILISTSSLLAVSPLIATISCNKSEDVDNATLTKAKDAFKLTPKTDKPITNVQASTITTENLKDYFTETPGTDFGTDKGFTYKLNSVTVNKDATKLDVVYDISYKGNTVKWTTTIAGFEDVNATLTKAKDAFKLTPKTDKPINEVEASAITNENLKDYFTETPGPDFGANKGFEYKINSVQVNKDAKNKLDVVYDISYKGKTVQWTTTIEGFKVVQTEGESGEEQDSQQQ